LPFLGRALAIICRREGPWDGRPSRPRSAATATAAARLSAHGGGRVALARL